MSDNRIMGIGGIGLFEENEARPVPSEKALERYEERIRRAQICGRCGASEMDGAMFTTNPSSGLCDDCCG